MAVFISLRAAARCVLLAAGMAAVAGCESLEPFNNIALSRQRREANRAKAVEMREKYLTTGDTRAIRWLLANSIDEGMEVDEINRILGQDGELETADRFVKTGKITYHVDDVTYRWGPDDHGKTYFLVFRDGKLVNFEPAHYGRAPD